MNIIQLILMSIGTLSLICLSLYIYLIIQGNSCILCERSTYNTPLKQNVFLVFAAIGFLICMFSGANVMLSWIPNDLGSVNSDGEFISLRIYLAIVFTVGCVAFLGLLDTITPDKIALRNTRIELAELGNFIDAYDRAEKLKELKIKYVQVIEGMKNEANEKRLIDVVLDCKSSPELFMLPIYRSFINRIEHRISTLHPK